MNDRSSQDTTEREADVKARIAKTADTLEHGWPRTSAMQAAIESARTTISTPLEDPQPEKPTQIMDSNGRADDRSHMQWREEFAHLVSYDRKSAGMVTDKWERRCQREGLSLPAPMTDLVEYTAQCRKRYLDCQAEYRGTLMYGCEILAEIGMAFDKLRPLMDRHRVGSQTLAKIEVLYADLVAEVAEAQTTPEPTR